LSSFKSSDLATPVRPLVANICVDQNASDFELRDVIITDDFGARMADLMMFLDPPGGCNYYTQPCFSTSAKVCASTDDGHETTAGTVQLTSNSIDLANSTGDSRTVAFRFKSVSLPSNATIKSSYIQFTGGSATANTTSPFLAPPLILQIELERGVQSNGIQNIIDLIPLRRLLKLLT